MPKHRELIVHIHMLFTSAHELCFERRQCSRLINRDPVFFVKGGKKKK